MSSSNYEHANPSLPSKCTWTLGTSEVSPHKHCPFKLVKPKILPNVLYAVGDTPLIKLNKIPAEYDLKCDLLAKCEFFNPGGSIKDRIALRMIEEAEREKRLHPGSTIIEPTSGNTGIGLALVSAVKGYNCVITLPDRMSQEKKETLKALGAEIIETPSNADFKSSESQYSVAENLCSKLKPSIILNQYRNPGNPLAHYDVTAEEILSQCDENIDMIVIGTGTGGTISGIGRKIKEKCPNCKVVGVDPHGSVMAGTNSLNDNNLRTKELEGIGHDYIPTTLDSSVVDKWVKVTDKDSFHMARSLIKKEGLLCGGTSGSAVYAAVTAAKELKKGQRCVIILPDGVRNYMTKFLSDSWMVEKEFINKDVELSSKHWWWTGKVIDLNMTEPFTILMSKTCREALDMMNDKNCDFLLVVDSSKDVRGIVTMKNLMNKTITGNVTCDSKISGIMNSTFNKITSNSTLGCLSKLLDKSSSVIVFDESKCYNEGKVLTKQTAIGMATRKDLMNFMLSEENRQNGFSSSRITNGFTKAKN